MKYNLILWTLLFITGSCQSQASARLQQDDSLPLDPAVRYGKLENGFTYYLRKTDSAEDFVRFDLIVKAGRDHEDHDQREYAHLLEHLVGKETRNFPNLKSQFKQDGRRKQALTGTRYTQYFTTIPENDKQVFKDGLQVLQDWTQGNEWQPESIAVERGAVEGEMRTNDPYRSWKKWRMEGEVLNKIGYKDFDTKKSLANLKIFNPKAFYRYYTDWYRPDLQAAIIVGNINVDSLENVIRERFGVLIGPPNPPDSKKYLDAQTVHFDGKVHYSTVTDSLEQGISLEILRVRPNLELRTKSRAEYQIMLLQQLYMILLSKRAQLLAEQYDPPFSHFWANYRSGHLAGQQINATQMSLELESDDLNTLKYQFQRGIKTWRQLHLYVDQTEIEEAKIELMENYRKPQLIGEFSERFLNHFVHGKAAPNPEVEAKLVKDLLKEISVRDLENFVKEKGGLDKNAYFIFFKGKNIELPPYEAFQQWIKEIDTKEIEPLKAPDPPIQTLEDVVDMPVSVEMRDVEVEKNLIGVSTVKLPNGIKLVLKPTPPALDLYNNTVTIQGFRPNKIPLDNPKAYLAAQAAPEVITYSGAGPYSKFEIDRFLLEKGMSLRLRLDKDNQLIYGKSKTNDVPELLNLLYLYLTYQPQDLKAFGAWKAYKRKELEGKGTRSAAFFMEKIIQLWYPELPVLKLKDLEQLDSLQVLRATQQWFSSIENYFFVVTGDFETEAILPVLIDKLSVFPTKEPTLDSKKNLEFPLKKIEEKIMLKNIDAAYVRLFFPVKVERDLKTKIMLQLLCKKLNERIYTRLRKGSYAPVASGDWLDFKRGIFAFSIEFDSTLGDEEKMIDWALEEFCNLSAIGVDKEWLAKAKMEELRIFESRFHSFHYYNFWQEYLQFTLKNGADLEKEVLEYGTILEHFINLEDVNAAGRKYLKVNNFQRFVGLPENYEN